MSPKRILHIPSSTYRLQFNVNFTFSNAEKLIKYIKKLGISDIYASPLTAAKHGSLHGYDGIDPKHLNKEIGDLSTFKNFCKHLRKNNLFLLLDIVPNHMSVSKENHWWQDLLLHRTKSTYAKYFDVAFTTEGNLIYRRFFDVNELVCLKMDNIEVFNAFHFLIFKLIHQNMVSGLRIDHIDGLLDPFTYLKRLDQRVYRLNQQRIYIIAEKILAAQEQLPKDWPIMGTTGYDFLNHLNSIFINRQGYQKIKAQYHQFSKQKSSWQDICHANKRWVIQHLFYRETTDLARLLLPLLNISCNDIQVISEVIIHLTVYLPVYRTYIRHAKISTTDKRYLTQAFKLSIKSAKDSQQKHILRTFRKRIFNLDNLTKRQRQLWLTWIKHWQQYTGPAMAKGYEDTTCYQYNPLISINEVGSSPDIINIFEKIDDLHRFLSQRQLSSRLSLNASSTHDTKRSEDVRARINVLSELSGEWTSLLKCWRQNTISLKPKIRGQSIPEFNLETFIYQSLLGVWPLNNTRITSVFKQRLKKIFIKVSRENKTRTTWCKPNSIYELALTQFVDNLFHKKNRHLFLSDFLRFQKKIAFYGMLNSLSQLLIKITAPGIPDIYQGCEEWSLTLVDPDNRARINFLSFKHKSSLSLPLKIMQRTWHNGHIKRYVTQSALWFRRNHTALFIQGKYIPLTVEGPKQRCIIAFARQYGQQYVIILALRFTSTLTQTLQLPLKRVNWGTTAVKLPKNFPTHFTNLFTQAIHLVESHKDAMLIKLSDIFNQFPIALLFNDKMNHKDL